MRGHAEDAGTIFVFFCGSGASNRAYHEPWLYDVMGPSVSVPPVLDDQPLNHRASTIITPRGKVCCAWFMCLFFFFFVRFLLLLLFVSNRASTGAAVVRFSFSFAFYVGTKLPIVV